MGFLIVVRLGSSVYRLWQQRWILVKRQAVLNELKVEQAKLEKQLEEVKSPGFVEKTIREELGWVKPGETVVIISKPASGGEDKINQLKKPSWRVWWGLFF